ncbi:MAG: nucleoside triphosphate pyrophosphohydrolase [Smithellaceae bacterium]
MNDRDNTQKELQELIALIRKLRAPDGCPWDRKQTARDIGKYLLDEAYEVLDALEEDDSDHLQEELGDLLFQILFIADIAFDHGKFSLADVMKSIKEKMIRRHPHVFSDVTVTSVGDVKANWQEIKNKERAGRSDKESIFHHVPRSLPALQRAQKITAIASRCGFDWPDTEGVWKKLEEEIGELSAARSSGNHAKMEEELGDVLFTLVNLSRFISTDAEGALTRTTGKFLRRFDYIATQLSLTGESPEKASLDAMDALWREAKEKGI